MAFEDNRGNNYRKNNRNYENKNRDYVKKYDSKPQYRNYEEKKKSNYFFDADEFKRENLIVKGFDGAEYVLDGDFGEQYSIDLIAQREKIEALQKAYKDDPNVENSMEVINATVDIVYGILKYDITDKKVTIEDVKESFPSIRMRMLFINKVIDFISPKKGDN